MKRVLIISPYFPPSNAADMQRVRMSLPYFKEFGWEPEVMTVHPKHSDFTKDDLLMQSVPADVPIHYVEALPKRWTSKLGLGSIALRSLPYYRRAAGKLLAQRKFDLVYFSTTQFPVCILGAFWKRRFNVPYVIDVQDPWHSEYYRNNPQAPRPPKYWLAYRLSKWLEPIAMRKVDGLMAVSQGYLTDLNQRYARCKMVPQRVITFGAFARDVEIAVQNVAVCPPALRTEQGTVNVVYVGRGGRDMAPAVKTFLQGFAEALRMDAAMFRNLRFHFIGTSYAAAGKGEATIGPVAAGVGLSDYVNEVTDRLPFYQTLNTLTAADGLFVPGSDDPQYTASKIYPYVMAGKPLFALFHPASSVVDFLRITGAGTVATLNQPQKEITAAVINFLRALRTNPTTNPIDHAVMEPYSARAMTARQCELFDEVTR